MAGTRWQRRPIARRAASAARSRSSSAWAPPADESAPPHFTPLDECPAVAWEVDEAHRFDLALLRESIAQPAEWHERYGFPQGVHRVLGAADATAEPAWAPVIVDRPQRSCVALIAAGQALLGFAAHTDGWQLHGEAPVLRLAEAGRDAVGDLTVAPAAWEEAWRLWCRQRHLPLSDAEACRLHCDGVHLDVAAPESFVQRLRAAKSDIFREESALLAGDGYLRAAALLRLQSQG